MVSSDNIIRHKDLKFEKFVFDNDENSLKPLSNRKTKIICTIGPVTKPVDTLCKLLERGMNIARLNFSHGTHEYHRGTIANIRKASEKAKINCAILLDTKGPEIRTGMLKEGKPVQLKKNQKIIIHCGPPPDFIGTCSDISVDYSEMATIVKVGDIIKIDDGLILIRVDNLESKEVHGTVLNHQELGERKGGIDTGLPAMTEKDERDILFGVDQEVDFIAPSFINSRDDVRQIRKVLGKQGVKGLNNFDSIMDESDGIMVARGDLGVEIPIQKVCMAQKTMIAKCNAVGKPIVTATQMLDSMIKNPSPTRAEAADVANAVFDGSDCVMLSGETAKGDYPLEAVSIMAKICRRSEVSIDHDFAFNRIKSISPKLSIGVNVRIESIASAAVKISMEVGASLIFALTDTGRTAGFVSKYMPPMPVLCVTPNERVARQALAHRNQWPLLVDESLDDQQRYECAKREAMGNGWCVEGDCVVFISGRQGVSGSAYQLKILQVNCDKQSTTNIKVHDIPRFKRVLLMTTVCPDCNFKCSDVQYIGDPEPKGVKYTLKSETATVSIPEIEFSTCAGAAKSTISVLEMIIKNFLKDVRFLINEEKEDSTKALRLNEIEMRLSEFSEGGEFTIVLDDPLGNSFIEEIGNKDNQLVKSFYTRSKEQVEAFGLVS